MVCYAGSVHVQIQPRDHVLLYETMQVMQLPPSDVSYKSSRWRTAIYSPEIYMGNISIPIFNAKFPSIYLAEWYYGGA